MPHHLTYYGYASYTKSQCPRSIKANVKAATIVIVGTVLFLFL